MSVNNEMTGLANAVRAKSGTTAKMGVSEMTKALSNMELFHFEQVNGVFGDGNLHCNLTAPNVPGYTFSHWINASSDGHDFPISIQQSTSKTNACWRYDQNLVKGDCNFHAVAVYVQNGFSKLGGVIKPLLCAVRQRFSPSLIGGVA